MNWGQEIGGSGDGDCGLGHQGVGIVVLSWEGQRGRTWFERRALELFLLPFFSLEADIVALLSPECGSERAPTPSQFGP